MQITNTMPGQYHLLLAVRQLLHASSSTGEETETIDIKDLPEVTNLVSDKPRLKSLQLIAFHR